MKGTADSSRARVLLIEDDQKLRKVVARVLARAYEVRVATETHEALALLAAGDRFDLILCDLMMPGVSGEDFHARVALIAREQADRVVFLSGGAFTPRAVAFLARTSIPCLDKPFGLEELLQFVRAQLLRVRGGEGPHSS
jgi:DNA-binding response OmpR family regulator